MEAVRVPDDVLRQQGLPVDPRNVLQERVLLDISAVEKQILLHLLKLDELKELSVLMVVCLLIEIQVKNESDVLRLGLALHELLNLSQRHL